MLPKYGLKVKLIGDVKVRRNGLGIAVQHDGFIATFFGCQYAMDTRVVKLDSLANAVRSRTEHDDFLVPGGKRFVFLIKGGIVVGSFCFELRRTRINKLVNPV